MNSDDHSSIEYPDEAGYPDGMGTLDEGTAGRLEDQAAEPSDDTGKDDTGKDGAEEHGAEEDAGEEGRPEGP
jgi:hypothetical protein